MSKKAHSLMVIALSCAALFGAWPASAQSVPADEAAQHLRQASALFNQQRFAEAAAAARRARELNPELLAAWRLSGLSLQLAERVAEAEREFAAALQLFPADADLWFYLARVQYLQSSLRPAEQAARRALILQADHAGAHTQLAMTLEALNDYPNALTHYQRGIELGEKQSRPPTLPLVYAANLLVKLNRLEEALAPFTRAIALEPRSSELRLGRGRALERLGRRVAAEQDYQQAIALDGNSQARAALARLRAGVTERRRDEETERRGDVVQLRNVAAQAKLDFVLRNGATPRKYQVETMTGGVAVLDYDGDGWQDIYFVNGAELPALKKTGARFWNRLYRNNQNGTFSDVTAQAGVAGEGYAMGAATADYDNDGDQDIFIAGVNRNLLYRNDGGGRFSDVTSKVGLTGVDPPRGPKFEKPWSVSAAWFDADNDGDLDLFVVNYCQWHPELDPYCGALKEGWRTYCFPDKYEGLPNQFFRNNGDGTFADVSAMSGIARHIGKGMGVAVADYDDDGFVDVFVANDTLPNFLFRNDGRGKFEEVALKAGVALNDNGRPVSSMGVDFRDYDNDGLPDLIFSALEGETFPLFRNLGKGFFADVTWPSGVGATTIKRSGWSLGLFDLNNDGWKDLFTVNAHVNDNIELYNEQTYRQANSLLINLGNGNFQDVAAWAGADLQTRRAHRGCAFADFDNDGRIDVVTTALNEPVELWRNESAQENHWLKLRLVGVRSNRDGIGAKIKLMTADNRAQFNHVTTSVGYASASSPLVQFGLGREEKVREIEIRWPSGAVQTLQDVAVDRLLNVTEKMK